MRKKIKFQLNMADGTQARTLEELREHFDLASVLGYYDDGKLYDWLSNRYCDAEAEGIAALDPSAEDFMQQLCNVLGVTYSESEAANIDLSQIVARNERYQRLKTFTADDEILAAVDRVAFSQKDLTGLLKRRVTEIYLCGERFEIPKQYSGVTYIGVNNPEVKVPANYAAMRIVLRDVDLYVDPDVDSIIKAAKAADKANDPEESAKQWRMAAEKGHPIAQEMLALCYLSGRGVNEDHDNAYKWFYEAVRNGNVSAATVINEGINLESATKWYRKNIGSLADFEKSNFRISVFAGEFERLVHGPVNIADVNGKNCALSLNANTISFSLVDIDGINLNGFHDLGFKNVEINHNIYDKAYFAADITMQLPQFIIDKKSEFIECLEKAAYISVSR